MRGGPEAPDDASVLRRSLVGLVVIATCGLTAVLLVAAVGVALHINENYVAGPLDQRYERLWATMSEGERWWSAFSKAVGPAPTFAPAALALVALLLLVATQRHTALRA